MKKFPRSLIKKIEERKLSDAFRELIDLDGYVDFFSNDYLGLAKQHSDNFSTTGSTGSRLISGNSKRTEEIEAELAAFFNADAALIFNSGYDANVGLFSSVPQKGDTIIYDELIHASITDGIRMSYANSYPFSHNNVAALADKLSRSKGNIYVAIESVYSMDGDTAPIKEILEICNHAGAYLIVDEAHAGGVLGEKGKGLVTKWGLDEQVFAKLITFGKAYGSHGAIILGSVNLRNYLINFARSFIYTTALPPHSNERLCWAVEQAAVMDQEREQLNKLIGYFRSLFQSSPYKLLQSSSQIQCLIVPGNEAAKALAQTIMDEKMAVKAILSPTVPEGLERLRFCLHSYNTLEEIEKLAEITHV